MTQKTKNDNILLINKPKGITSFDVIRHLRRKLGVKKMGHSGTLDPLAEGLLIIGINQGTKKLNEYIKLDKIYEAEILLGKKTDTGDLAGKILKQAKVKKIDLEIAKKILANLPGTQKLAVPIYSAIKQQGQPLYKKARRGEKIKPPIRNMHIYWLKLLDHYPNKNKYVLKIKLKVASGTYVRSIAEEIGKRLGLPATLKSLKRTQVGEFKLSQATKINRL